MTKQERYIEKIKTLLPKSILEKEYCVNFLNEKEISDKYNITQCGVRKLIQIYSLIRDSKQVKSYKNHKAKSKRYDDIKKEITRDILYKWYVEEDNSYIDGPKHFNISQWIFDKLCSDYNIKKDRKETCKKSVQTRESKAGGKDNYSKQLTEVRNKTIIAKYGSIENYNKHKSDMVRKTWEENHQEILDKIHMIKKINNSFNSSKPEDQYYNYLLTKYEKDDIVRQYKDIRYPFECDFYIRSEDLFIELNLNWTHGNHPFDSTNEEDLQLLDHWRQKAINSEFYRNAIDIWTRRDIEKQRMAKENNLNYLCYYSEDDMYGE